MRVRGPGLENSRYLMSMHMNTIPISDERRHGQQDQSVRDAERERKRQRCVNVNVVEDVVARVYGQINCEKCHRCAVIPYLTHAVMAIIHNPQMYVTGEFMLSFVSILNHQCHKTQSNVYLCSKVGDLERALHGHYMRLRLRMNGYNESKLIVVVFYVEEEEHYGVIAMRLHIDEKSNIRATAKVYDNSKVLGTHLVQDETYRRNITEALDGLERNRTNRTRSSCEIPLKYKRNGDNPSDAPMVMQDMTGEGVPKKECGAIACLYAYFKIKKNRFPTSNDLNLGNIRTVLISIYRDMIMQESDVVMCENQVPLNQCSEQSAGWCFLQENFLDFYFDNCHICNKKFEETIMCQVFRKPGGSGINVQLCCKCNFKTCGLCYIKYIYVKEDNGRVSAQRLNNQYITKDLRCPGCNCLVENISFSSFDQMQTKELRMCLNREEVRAGQNHSNRLEKMKEVCEMFSIDWPPINAEDDDFHTYDRSSIIERRNNPDIADRSSIIESRNNPDIAAAVIPMIPAEVIQEASPSSPNHPLIIEVIEDSNTNSAIANSNDNNTVESSISASVHNRDGNATNNESNNGIVHAINNETVENEIYNAATNDESNEIGNHETNEVNENNEMDDIAENNEHHETNEVNESNEIDDIAENNEVNENNEHHETNDVNNENNEHHETNEVNESNEIGNHESNEVNENNEQDNNDSNANDEIDNAINNENYDDENHNNATNDDENHEDEDEDDINHERTMFITRSLRFVQTRNTGERASGKANPMIAYTKGSHLFKAPQRDIETVTSFLNNFTSFISTSTCYLCEKRFYSTTMLHIHLEQSHIVGHCLASEPIFFHSTYEIFHIIEPEIIHWYNSIRLNFSTLTQLNILNDKAMPWRTAAHLHRPIQLEYTREKQVIKSKAENKGEIIDFQTALCQKIAHIIMAKLCIHHDTGGILHSKRWSYAPYLTMPYLKRYQEWPLPLQNLVIQNISRMMTKKVYKNFFSEDAIHYFDPDYHGHSVR